MFFSRCRENALTWESRARQLETRVAELEAERDRAHQGKLAAEAQASELQGEIEKCNRIYKTMGEFADHHNCRLGKWYHEGEGHDCFSKLAGFREVDEPHKRFHDNGMEAIRQFHDGEYMKGFAAIAAMEDASMKVLAELDRIAKSGEADTSLLCH